jgi:hypothetical protein
LIPASIIRQGGRLANLNKMLADKIDRLPDDFKTAANEQIKKSGI